MRVILWNLKRFAQNRTLFFALTIVCVLTSSWLMLFGYGMYQNYRLEKEYTTEEALQFAIKGAHVEPPEKTEENKHYIHIPYKPFTKGGLDECIAKIPNDILNNIALWKARLGTPENPLDGPNCYFYYQDGQCYASTWLWDQRYDEASFPTPSGRFFSETEMAETAKVAISSSEKLKLGEFIVFLGKAYKIIGIGCGVDQILYEAAPDDASMYYITLTLKRPLTAKQYEEFSAAFSTLDVVLPEYTPFYNEDYWLYNTILLVSILIAVVAALNLMVLYHYILMKRQKSMAVFQICGCTRGKAIAMYSIESLFLTVPTYLIAAASYHYFLLPLLSKVFPYMETAYSTRLYGLAFAIMVTACTVAIFCLSLYIICKFTIVERREGVS